MTEYPDSLKFMSEIKNEAATAIIKEMDAYPDRWYWTSDSHNYIKHKSSRIELDISDLSMHLYHPYKVKFGWINWFRLRRAFKRWRRASGNAQKEAAERNALLGVINHLKW